MQNRSYRARTGGYRPSGSAPRRPSVVPASGASRPRPGAHGQSRPPAGSAARSRAGNPAHPSSQRPPAGARSTTSGGVRRPSQHPAQGNAPRPPQHPPGGQRRPGAQPSRRPPSRPPQRRKKGVSPFALAALACIALIGAYVIHTLSIVGVGTPTFINNVTINDISFAGMTHEDGVAKAKALEEEWLNTTYTFSYLDYSWPFTRAMVGADIDYDVRIEQAWNLGHIGSIAQRKRDIRQISEHPINIPVTITYDEALVEAFIDEICTSIDVDAVDAVVVADVDKPVVLTNSQTGLKVNREQLNDQVLALINTDQVDTALPVETVFPAVNSDDVSFQTIAQFSTDVSFRNRKSRTNVRIALSAFNGLSVQPGETVSFNEIVGERTEANGFQKATEYAGDMTTEGVGGGVCQASTTLYNALIMANMTILDRDQHTMTVSYVDPSLDAAVSWPKKDLQFKNETNYSIYIYTSVTDDTATVKIYGHRPEYFYRLESVIIEESIPSTKINYIEDTEGKHVIFTDETFLESEGKPGCVSEGWIVAYDWNTKQEVSRTKISRDKYSPGASVYYRGVVDRSSGTMHPTTQPVEQ